MAITTSDILTKLAVTTGSAGNTTAQANPSASLGKYVSTTALVDNTFSNLFDDISGDENAASTVDYRCVFIHNSHATLTLQGPKLWIDSEVSGGASIALGVDTTAASAVGASPAQALTVANELTAPSGVSFSAPTTKAGGLSLGDIGPGQVKAFWVRRTAANTSAVDDGATWKVEGDTNA